MSTDSLPQCALPTARPSAGTRRLLPWAWGLRRAARHDLQPIAFADKGHHLLQIMLLVVGSLLIAATLLPLLRLDDWWIRIFDFPRLQLAALLAATLGATLLWLPDRLGLLHGLFVAALAGCTLYQGWRMLPYTPLWRKQVLPATRDDPDASFSVLCANVLMTNRSAAGLLALIEQHDPDVVLAAESDAWWQEALACLERTHPHTVLQAQDNTYGLLLYSKLELPRATVKFLVEDDIPSIHGSLRMRCGREIELRCLHPRPPAPGESTRSTERDAELLIVAKEVKALNVPTVVFGDLNDVAWSRTNDLFCVISGLLDPRIGRGFFHTFNSKWPLIRFPLDHLFHSRHFRLRAFKRLPHWGSDHFPVYIALSFEPEASHEQQQDTATPEDRAEAQEKVDKA